MRSFISPIILVQTRFVYIIRNSIAISYGKFFYSPFQLCNCIIQITSSRWFYSGFINPYLFSEYCNMGLSIYSRFNRMAHSLHSVSFQIHLYYCFHSDLLVPFDFSYKMCCSFSDLPKEFLGLFLVVKMFFFSFKSFFPLHHIMLWRYVCKDIMLNNTELVYPIVSCFPRFVSICHVQLQ